MVNGLGLASRNVDIDEKSWSLGHASRNVAVGEYRHTVAGGDVDEEKTV